MALSSMKTEVYRRCREAGQKGKRGFVYVITSEKFIRSIMYGSAIPIVGKGVETFGLAVSAYTPYDIPLPPLVWVTMVVIFVAAFWADEHTEEWRDKVEEKTGEEAADE